MYLAGTLVVGFIVTAVYAVGWLRGRRDRYHRAAMIVPLSFAAVAAPAQLVVGDWAARSVAEAQPTKLAAMEGLEKTTKGADLTIGGVYFDGEVHGGISVPDGLSLLADHDPNAPIEGLDATPATDRPPVGVVRNSFQAMVGIGTFLALLAVIFLWLRWRGGRLPASRWYYRALIAAAPLSVVALIAGWITTEVGRQPWVVYEVMRTEESVTGAEGIPVGYATLVVVYLGLGAAVVWLLRRIRRQAADAKPEALP
jgi:cytochrome d ubiquinol oxidase subunit I